MLNQPPSASSQNSSSCRRCSVDRPLEPPGIGVGLEQLEQPEDQVRVVLGVAVDLRMPVAIAPQQRAASRAPQRARERTRRRAGRRRGTGSPPARRRRRALDARAPSGQTRRSSARSRPSAPCRRGAAAAARAARRTRQRARGETSATSSPGVPVRAPGRRPSGDVQQVLARELLLRIGRRVAAGLDAEAALHDGRVRRRAARRARRRATGRRRLRTCAAPGSCACSGGTLSASSAE